MSSRWWSEKINLILQSDSSTLTVPFLLATLDEINKFLSSPNNKKKIKIYPKQEHKKKRRKIDFETKINPKTVFLPNEIWWIILGKLSESFKSKVAQLVCRNWRKNRVITKTKFSYKKLSELAKFKQTLKFATATFPNLRIIENLPLVITDNITNETMQYFPQSLQTLDLSYCKRITGKGLKCLPQSLQTLKLKYCQKITDEGLKCLPQSLQTLSLRSTEITDEGLKCLPQSLQTLNLRGTEITLNLRSTEITDEGLKYIPQSLQTLTLAHCRKITDEGLKYLPQSLQTLKLKYCQKITDECLKYLPQSLQTLTLAHCRQITDEGLKCLPQTLYLGGTEIMPYHQKLKVGQT